MNRNGVTTRFAIVGIVLPLAATAVALAVQVITLPSLPDPVAIHWGTGGVDGSGPAWSYPLLTLLFGAGVPAWLWLSGLPRLRRGARGWWFRFLAAFALGFAVFGAVSWTWAVLMQSGLASWRDAPSVLPAIIVGAVLGVGAGVVGFVVQPKTLTVFEELPTTHLDVASGERVAWLGVAKASGGMVAAIGAAIALCAAGTVFAWVRAEFATMWPLLAVTVVLALAAASTLEADVSVDERGVEVRGPAGLPRIRIPLESIASASAVSVEALGTFGGWGWRRIPGAQGVILRSGDALRVERIGGPVLVVTVEGAATAAALVNALLASRSA